MAIKRILVIGGNGYIGKVLTEELAKEFDVTLLLRKKLENNPYKFFIADLLDKKSLIKNIKNFDIVVDSASVVRTIDKRKYEENIVGMHNLIDVLRKNEIKKIIYFSTQNVNLKNKGDYAKSKKISEDILKNSNLDYVIVRPNLVYNIGEGNDISRLVFVISRFGVAPLIGKAERKFQPVLREDLTKIILKLIKKFKTKSIIEISGERMVSISEIVAFVDKRFNRHSLRINIPSGLLRLFKCFIPFDIEGFDEDIISEKPYREYEFSSFYNNLEKICSLIKK